MISIASYSLCGLLLFLHATSLRAKSFSESFDCLEGCPATDAPAGPPPPPIDPADITHNGNYLISNCAGEAAGLQQRLVIYGQQVQRAVDSLSDPNFATPPGFISWFKNAANVPTVKDILSLISVGNNIVYNGGAPVQPQLLCISDGSTDTKMQEWWIRCSNPDPRKRPIGFTIPNSGTVGLCPRFFELPDNSPARCPSNLLDLVQNQFGTLVHEWVHVFGDSDAGKQLIGGTFGPAMEQYDPKYARKLDRFDSKQNAQVRWGISCSFRLLH